MPANKRRENAYIANGFLCGICARALTESCYRCGPANYWQSFTPRMDALENPPEFPAMKEWHSAGYGEKLNVLGFYMRAMMGKVEEKPDY
jgi:hypothetical protein